MQTNSYDAVYKWFNYLKSEGHYVWGYVIVPNYFPALIGFKDVAKNINQIFGDGKRFLAYDRVKRLKEQNNTEL